MGEAAHAPPPRIGLSPRLMHRPPEELGFPGKTLQYIEQSVAHWIMGHGALAFMVPTLTADSGLTRRSLSVKDCVAALDALVLQGGADMAPQSYGETPLAPEWAGDRVRDLYEIELFWECVIQGKPVLGICRGAQLINVAMGGSLYQDIALQHPGAGAHRDEDLYDSHHHTLTILPGSGLAQLYPGRRRVSVNSIHHQAIHKLGRDLVVEAVAEEDGIVEAVRWRGHGYVLGLQWHPEFHPGFPDLLDPTPIMEEFLDATRARR
jgi:putative glutamine amidotransferase